MFSMIYWQIWLEKLNYIFLSSHEINRRNDPLVFPVGFCWWSNVPSCCSNWGRLCFDPSTGKQGRIWTAMTCCPSGFEVLLWPLSLSGNVQRNRPELVLKAAKVPIKSLMLSSCLWVYLCKNRTSVVTQIMISTALNINQIKYTVRHFVKSM